ncbi:MAG: Crp/Fnr family transcriptional regulator [Pseudomonadota bacterium]
MAQQAKNETPAQCADCLVKNRAICHVLDAEALARFAASGRRRHVAAGETVQWQGDDDGVCATLTSGALKLSLVTETGEERVVGTAYPPDFIGSPFAGAASMEVTALIDSELCVFSRAAFSESLDRNRALEQELLRRTMAELERSRLDDSRLASLGAGPRVAALLADFSKRTPAGCDAGDPDAGWLRLPLSRGEIAALLDLRIETVSRELGALERAGVVQRRGRRDVRILDMAALTAAAAPQAA